MVAVTTYVLVPGACHGGWCFDRLTGQLRDLVGALEAERVENAVLVGHSYGGMVITGAADRVPDLVDALVYVDAFVPRDGESCWQLTDDRQREWYLSVAETGYAKEWDGGSPFQPTYERLIDDPLWNVHALDGKHDLMRDAPDELLRIVLDAG